MKQELSKQTEFEIRTRLYPLIMLLLERRYDVTRASQRENVRIVFSEDNKKKVLEEICEEIKKFVKESQEPLNLVKDYLFELIEQQQRQSSFPQEHEVAKKVVTISTLEIEVFDN